MLRRTIVLFALFAFVASALAQRRLAEVKPQEMDEGLVFDINEFPVDRNIAFRRDFNVAPTVVHTRDSERAFVSFTSTNRVAVFSTRTGEILNIVEVCKNPGQMTMTPDGQTVVLPCLFISENQPQPDDLEGDQVGAIAIIDVDSLQVRRIDLTETVFSVSNNIVVSPDSSTGFISSIRTDEILRFDIGSAMEVGPRIQFEAGTRPAALTMGPDGSFFGAVLVGSNALPRSQVPDSVQIIDVESFSVIHSLGFQPDFEANPQALTFDFRAANRVTFSNDGKLAFIADQANSQGALQFGQPPGLFPDRALLIDVENEELLEVFNLSSGQGGPAWTSPDGQFFVATSVFNIDVIGVENRIQFSITPNPSEFQGSTRPAFTDDGVMWIGAPFTDFVMAVRLFTGEVFRGDRFGGFVEREFQGSTIQVPSAPLDVSFTPDKSRLVVLNFNANTLEILEPTSPLFSPELLSANDNSEGEIEPDDLFTGVALANMGERTANLKLSAFSDSGLLFSDMEATEEVVEFQNPTEEVLEPNQQISFTLNEQLMPDPGEEPPADLAGWVDVDTEATPLAGIFLTFNRELTKLDGGPMVPRGFQFLSYPEPRLEPGVSNELVLVNPNLSGAFSATITLADRENNVISQVDQTVVARSRRSFLLADPSPDDEEPPELTVLFGQDDLEGFEGGFVTVVVTGGLISYLRVSDEEGMAVLPGIPFAGEGVNIGFARLQAPQVIAFGGSQTILKMVNQSDQDTTVTLNLRDDSGAVAAGPVIVELPSGNSTLLDVAEAFELEDTGRIFSGWVDIASQQVRLAGYAEIRAFNGRALTMVPFQPAAFREWAFPHVAQGLGLTTGLAVVNPGEELANVELQLRRPDGSLVESAAFTLGGGERRIDVVPNLFPSLSEELLSGTIRLISDQVVSAIELFFSDNGQQLAAVPATGLGQPEIPPLPEPEDEGEDDGGS